MKKSEYQTLLQEYRVDHGQNSIDTPEGVKAFYEHVELQKHAKARNRSRCNDKRFALAKQAAKRRHKIWLLSFIDYEHLITQDCFYCEGYFPKVEMGIGLDRMDGSKGYEVDNVVSCCETCNMLKSNVFSVEETKAAVRAIIEVRKASCASSVINCLTSTP